MPVLGLPDEVPRPTMVIPCIVQAQSQWISRPVRQLWKRRLRLVNCWFPRYALFVESRPVSMKGLARTQFEHTRYYHHRSTDRLQSRRYRFPYKFPVVALISLRITARLPWETHLLCGTRSHVEVDVLQISALGDLPVNTAYVGIGRCIGNVDHEVADGPQEVVLRDIPGKTNSVSSWYFAGRRWQGIYHSAPFPPSIYTSDETTPRPTKLDAARMTGRFEGCREIR